MDTATWQDNPTVVVTITAARKIGMQSATYSVPWAQVVGYFIISSAIVLGNAMVVVAVAKFRHLQTIPNMFVVGVAAMDMVFSLTGFSRTVDLIVPNLMTGLIPCLFRIGFGTTNATVNGLMLTALAAERFIGTFHPLRYPEIVTMGRVKVVSVDVHSPEDHNDIKQRKKNMKAIKNLSLIAGLFTCCLTPYLIQSIVFSYNPSRYQRQPAILVSYNITLLMLIMNSLINPIVYAFRFKPFTVAFKIMLGMIKIGDRNTAISEVI